MSEFSEKCKLYIEKSGTNIFRLAKQYNLERTMLQKVVRGTRIPGEEFFNTLLDALNLNKKEKDELRQLYHIEKIGRQVYERRKMVENLIASFDTSKKILLSEEYDYTFNETLNVDKDMSTLNNSVAVVSAIAYVINYEYEHSDQPLFYLNDLSALPFTMRHLVIGDNKHHKPATVTQFLYFARYEGDAAINSNFATFQRILPFAFTFVQPYAVYYSYVSQVSQDLRFTLWPYYLITHEHVLLMSGDGNRGLLIHDKQIANGYRFEMEKQKQLFNLLMVNRLPLEENMEIYQDALSRNRVQISYESNPCIYLMFDHLDIPLKMNDEQKEIYDLYMFNNHPEALPENNESFRCLYEIGDFENFFKNGQLPGIYNYFLPSLNQKLIDQLFQNYCKNARKANCYHEIKKGELGQHSGLIIELCESHFVIITAVDRRDPYDMLFINEGTIHEAFYDYFESLINEGHILSAEDSIAHLEALYDRAKEQKTTGIHED